MHACCGRDDDEDGDDDDDDGYDGVVVMMLVMMITQQWPRQGEALLVSGAARCVDIALHVVNGVSCLERQSCVRCRWRVGPCAMREGNSRTSPLASHTQLFIQRAPAFAIHTVMLT